MSLRPVNLVSFARQVPYREALHFQRLTQAKLIDLRKKGTPEPGALFLLQHPPVYTMGRCSKEEYVLDKSVEIIRVERGGEVTYHGPGQLVGYLILDLEFFKKDLHWVVRSVEESIIRTVAEYDVQARRVEGKSGVWVGNSKVAAVGLGAKNWVTIHGFALNMFHNVLPGFNFIVPCGIKSDVGSVTSLGTLVDDLNNSGGRLKEDEITQTVCKHLSNVFGFNAVADHPEWLKSILESHPVDSTSTTNMMESKLL